MKPESVKFIYRAANAVASGKHHVLTKQCLTDAIEQELIATRASKDSTRGTSRS